MDLSRRVARVAGAGAMWVAAIASAGPAVAVHITEMTIPTAQSGAAGITAGPDGRVWFCESGADQVGAVTTDGTFTEYPIRHGAGCSGIAAAIGLLYYTESATGKLGIMGPTGATIDGLTLSTPYGVTKGRDGRVWVAQQSGSALYAVPLFSNSPPAGTFSLSSGAGPTGVAVGPDGRIWTAGAGGKIGACDPAAAGAACAEFTAPAGSEPWGIAAGPDGALWFTEYAAGAIGRITTAGVITTYFTPTAGSGPKEITLGPDGALWFTEEFVGKIGRIAPGGLIEEYPIPTSGAYPNGIALGPDGAIWFTEPGADKIGRVQVRVPGDVNADGVVDVLDVFFLINYLFAGGDPPL